MYMMIRIQQEVIVSKMVQLFKEMISKIVRE